MELSYSIRLACLAIVAVGLPLIALEMAISLSARPILSFLQPLPARIRERLICLVQIAPLLAGLLFAGLFCIPQYIRNEPQAGAERVGWVSPLLAAIILVWFGISFSRGLRAILHTARFAAACRRVAEPGAAIRNGIPVLTVPEAAPAIALVGLARPFILLSGKALASAQLTEAELRTVLDHESSHARHRDNWKLLTLCALPKCPFRLPGGVSWLDHWRNAADLAADRDAAGSDRGRALALAQALVTMARHAPASASPLLACWLSHADCFLQVRVESLLAGSAGSGFPRRLLIIAAVTAALVLAGAIAVTPWLDAMSERLLHLG